MFQWWHPNKNLKIEKIPSQLTLQRYLFINKTPTMAKMDVLMFIHHLISTVHGYETKYTAQLPGKKLPSTESFVADDTGIWFEVDVIHIKVSITINLIANLTFKIRIHYEVTQNVQPKLPSIESFIAKEQDFSSEFPINVILNQLTFTSNISTYITLSIKY